MNNQISNNQISVQDVINQLGGLELINNIGANSNNKYMVDVENTINEQLFWVHQLNLDKSAPLSILDMGTGAGLFPYICREYGHNVDSCDYRLSPGWWNNGYTLLNINPKHYYVYKYKSVGNTFDQKFDIIVSFRSCIGTTTYGGIGAAAIDVWDVDEWKFFLKDCSTNLLKSNNSFLYFQCNKGCNLPPYVDMNLEEISIWGSKELGKFFLPYQVDPRKNIFRITKKQIDSL